MKIKFTKTVDILLLFIAGVFLSGALFAKEFNGSWILADSNKDPFEIQLN